MLRGESEGKTDGGSSFELVAHVWHVVTEKSQKQISKDKAHQSQTAGRYGMGLTLCLLHAQRLVPNSCALIKSATPSAKVWTKEKFVVDTINDRIISVEEETLSKNTNESGTVCRLHVYHKC